MQKGTKKEKKEGSKAVYALFKKRKKLDLT